ncbi:MAG TPA: hypothetical protein VH877_17085 [Polyangia bacterium]|nr:hypothetical protein [Polyangia bacterium]
MNGPDKKPPPIPTSPAVTTEERGLSGLPLRTEITDERRKTSPYGTAAPRATPPPAPPPPSAGGERHRAAPPLSGNEPVEPRRTLRPGGVQSLVFEMVRAVLQRHIGPATVEGLLTMACKRSGIAPEVMRVRELDLLVEELMPSLRTLCDAEKLPRLLTELDQLHQLRG